MAAGPPVPAAAAVPWTSLQGKKPTARHFFRDPLETAKHHLISCRKWREIIRNNKVPGGRNVPSEIVLESYSLTSAVFCYAECCCCWWLLGLLFLLFLLLDCCSCWSCCCIIWLLLVCHAAAAGGCWASCSCCCCSCCSCCCIAAASAAAAASGGGDADAGVCWCCCCSCRAMNQLPRQETNSHTFFSKPTRNSKTPPNFVPKMTRNHSQ